jgi:hypothetical protein
MKVEIKEVCTSIILSILSDIVSITPVAATSTIMMDNGDNSSLSDNEHLAAGLNEDVDVDAGMLNAIYDLSTGVTDNDDENDGRDDSAKSQHGWNILMGSRRPSPVSISLDGVDSRLLKKLELKFQRLSNESRKSSLARRRIATYRKCPLVIS